MDATYAWIAAAALLMLVLGAFVVWWSRLRRHRWGSVATKPTDAPAGAYRSATLQGTKPRGTPWTVMIGAWLSFLWAAPTLLLFVPGGFLACLIAFAAHPAIGAAVLVITLSGLGLCAGMVAAGITMLEAAPRSAVIVRVMGVWVLVHHLLVIGVFAVWAVLPASEAELAEFCVMLSAIPCTIGVIVGTLQLIAAHMMAKWIVAPEEAAETPPHPVVPGAAADGEPLDEGSLAAGVTPSPAPAITLDADVSEPGPSAGSDDADL